jgi:hypothetical protein
MKVRMNGTKVRKWALRFCSACRSLKGTMMPTLVPRGEDEDDDDDDDEEEEDEEAAAVVEAGPPLIVAAASELHPRRRLALGAPSPSPSSPTHPPAPPLVPLAEGACGRSHTLSLEEAWYQYLRALDLE